MKRAFGVVSLGVLVVGLVFTACGKKPRVVAESSCTDSLAFLTWLPQETVAAGYVELGDRLDHRFSAWAGPSAQPMQVDITAMMKRRWGADISGVKSLGFAVIDKEPVIFASPISGQLAAPQAGKVEVVGGGKLMVEGTATLGQIGSVLLVGKRSAVEKILTQRGQANSTVPQWLAALPAGSKGAFIGFGLHLDESLNASDREAREVKDLESIIGFARSHGMELTAHARAQQGENAEAAIRSRIEQLRQYVVAADAPAQASSEVTSELARVVVRHFGHAVLDSFVFRRDGDRLFASLPWRLPSVTAGYGVAPGWQERAILPDEYAAAQFNFGGPLIDTVLNWIDVLGKPLDHAALKRELLAVVQTATGVSVADVRAIALSAAADHAVVSWIAGEPTGQGKLAPALAQELAVVSAPWGAALARKQDAAVVEQALMAKPASRLVDEQPMMRDAQDTVMRATADLTRLPSEIAAKLSDMPVTRAALRVQRTAGLTLELATRPGASAQLVAGANMMKVMLKGQSDTAYQNRTHASAAEELQAIIAYHQGRLLDQSIEVTDLGSDKVRIRLTNSAGAAQVMDKLVVPIAVVGIAAAVAIPAFIAYRQRAESSMQLAK